MSFNTGLSFEIYDLAGWGEANGGEEAGEEADNLFDVAVAHPPGQAQPPPLPQPQPQPVPGLESYAVAAGVLGEGAAQRASPGPELEQSLVGGASTSVI